MTEKLTEPNGAEVTVSKSQSGGVKIKKYKPNTRLVTGEVHISKANINDLLLAIATETGREIK